MKLNWVITARVQKLETEGQSRPAEKIPGSDRRFDANRFFFSVRALSPNTTKIDKLILDQFASALHGPRSNRFEVHSRKCVTAD